MSVPSSVSGPAGVSSSVRQRPRPQPAESNYPPDEVDVAGGGNDDGLGDGKANGDAPGVPSSPVGRSSRRNNRSSRGSKSGSGKISRGEESSREGDRQSGDRDRMVVEYNRAFARVRHETVQEGLRQGQVREKALGSGAGRSLREARWVKFVSWKEGNGEMFCLGVGWDGALVGMTSGSTLLPFTSPACSWRMLAI